MHKQHPDDPTDPGAIVKLRVTADVNDKHDQADQAQYTGDHDQGEESPEDCGWFRTVGPYLSNSGADHADKTNENEDDRAKSQDAVQRFVVGFHRMKIEGGKKNR